MLDQGWTLNVEESGPVWAWFDADTYSRADAAAARAARQGAAAALADWEERGAALGHSPNRLFDGAYYLSTYPDVAAAVASGAIRSAFDHYRMAGWRDHDPHWLFSVAHYSRLYGDLTPEAVDETGGLYGHYLAYGAKEGRSPHPFFDAKAYLQSLPKARAKQAAGNPFLHYLKALDATSMDGSAAEPRASLYFDPAWYLATYPDMLRPEPGAVWRGALHQYLTRGVRIGHDPLCDFSEGDYLHDNPDVQAAMQLGHFTSGFQHFLEYGVNGSRSPSRDVNLAWYAGQPEVVRDLETGRWPNAFAHMLDAGLSRGLPLKPPVSPDFAPAETDARAQFLVQAQRAMPGYGRRPLQFGVQGTPDVSVIVVLRNQFALTMQTLASLRANYAGAIELIIVDNASSDGTTGIGDLVHGARIMRMAENLGFLRGCNAALPHATAAAILYLNNDVVLQAGAIQAALDRLASAATIGAVGGKVIRTHGLLQEAGCILWRDGSAEGWLRDAAPDAAEANYLRDVDFCSGCFLMVRGELLRQLGGFDDAFAPAYYEEVDLCLRIQAAGFRVVYDPAVALVHYEYGSSRSARAAAALMVANRATLRARHPAALRNRVVDRRRRAEAAALASLGRRVLFVEDTVPLPRLGSGFGRASDVVRGLVAAGWQATVFPMHSIRTPVHQITAALPETAEILWDRDHRSLEAFLDERRGFYDLVWISRAHNLRQVFGVINRAGIGLEGAKLVLDTEAVFSLRDAARAELDGLPFGQAAALAREFEGAWLCDHVIAVNEAEAAVLRQLPISSVGVVGFDVPARPTPAAWGERKGLLHIGALPSNDCPNAEGLRWFLEHVHPELEAKIGAEAARLTVVGHMTDGVDLTWLKTHKGVDFLGMVGDLEPLYERHRVFVAPTRFAAGVPTKVLDAVSRGVPVACTDLLAKQLGWAGNTKILAAPRTDAAQFVANVAKLVEDRKAWTRVREAGLTALAADCSPARFAEQIAAATKAAGRG